MDCDYSNGNKKIVFRYDFEKLGLRDVNFFFFAGICSFDGLIYVCGGYDGASCLSSMERFDPLTGVWCSCPAMNTRRRYCRISVVGEFAATSSSNRFLIISFYRKLYLCIRRIRFHKLPSLG